MTQHQATDAGRGELVDEIVHGRWMGSPPGECRDPVGPRIETDGEPVTGDGDAFPQPIRLVDDAHRQDDAGRSRGERETDVVGRLEAPGELQWDRDA